MKTAPEKPCVSELVDKVIMAIDLTILSSLLSDLGDVQVIVRTLEPPERGCDLHIAVSIAMDGQTYRMSLYCLQTTSSEILEGQIRDGFSPENLGWIALPTTSHIDASLDLAAVVL